jgi:hypothetical protein
MVDEGHPELEEVGPLPETEHPNFSDAGIELTVAPAEDAPEPEMDATEPAVEELLGQGFTDTRQQIAGMLGEHRLKSRKRKPGRPRIRVGIAGLLSRTTIEPKHVSEYVRLRALDLIDRLGGPDHLAPEQDAVIGATMGGLELVLRVQALARTDETVIRDPRILGLVSRGMSEFYKGLKLLGLTTAQKKERADPQQLVALHLRDVARRKGAKK